MGPRSCRRRIDPLAGRFRGPATVFSRPGERRGHLVRPERACAFLALMHPAVRCFRLLLGAGGTNISLGGFFPPAAGAVGGRLGPRPLRRPRARISVTLCPAGWRACGELPPRMLGPHSGGPGVFGPTLETDWRR
ncbi:hypothetical protein NDU88_000583 [Pleurodeles waltl]|uniref:Uncharacterized protein n=1 Tax=Pleurodeles waltl TaxID=8319 RepID=A0AAV7P4L6_PLEWA|nr:hypothetical protein NDU88_000583 [Pleurodeles waltl]